VSELNSRHFGFARLGVDTLSVAELAVYLRSRIRIVLDHLSVLEIVLADHGLDFFALDHLLISEIAIEGVVQGGWDYLLPFPTGNAATGG
jgi:hypothetical protein